MRRRQTHKPKTERLFPEAVHTGLPSIPAAAAFSFLKETRGLTTWTARDMARTFSIAEAEAKKVIAVLELHGYPAKKRVSGYAVNQDFGCNFRIARPTAKNPIPFWH